MSALDVSWLRWQWRGVEGENERSKDRFVLPDTQVRPSVKTSLPGHGLPTPILTFSLLPCSPGLAAFRPPPAASCLNNESQSTARSCTDVTAAMQIEMGVRFCGYPPMPALRWQAFSSLRLGAIWNLKQFNSLATNLWNLIGGEATIHFTWFVKGKDLQRVYHLQRGRRRS